MVEQYFFTNLWSAWHNFVNRFELKKCIQGGFRCYELLYVTLVFVNCWVQVGWKVNYLPHFMSNEKMKSSCLLKFTTWSYLPECCIHGHRVLYHDKEKEKQLALISSLCLFYNTGPFHFQPSNVSAAIRVNDIWNCRLKLPPLWLNERG